MCLNPAYQLQETEYALQKVRYISPPAFTAATHRLCRVKVNPLLLLSQTGCKAVVCPTQFKSQRYCDMLRQMCPEIDSCSPGNIKGGRYSCMGSTRQDIAPSLVQHSCVCSAQTPGPPLCDCSGQSTVGNVSSGGHDAGRQQPVRAAAPGSAEETLIRRPRKHPFYFGNCGVWCGRLSSCDTD